MPINWEKSFKKASMRALKAERERDELQAEREHLRGLLLKLANLHIFSPESCVTECHVCGGQDGNHRKFCEVSEAFRVLRRADPTKGDTDGTK